MYEFLCRPSCSWSQSLRRHIYSLGHVDASRSLSAPCTASSLLAVAYSVYVNMSSTDATAQLSSFVQCLQPKDKTTQMWTSQARNLMEQALREGKPCCCTGLGVEALAD